ncbi:mannitol dehydrogenase family protein [Alsobacter sp. SYSU M60028]|uniref:Mannitol dehydrogenase family protein n=1 Tax=Alsobacter ponti TaxID=2962936 RepID=A0ABT1LFZ3_9HYPH|nr:mannitol dehydrogenase family protein [Alsobacter ponti]MCP8940016.1 mannitol dehydrogenase family protein [Alsobacter ponti]
MPQLQRLSPATLIDALAGTARPTYDRERLKPGIVHLGLGAFFRAHGAIYTEDVLPEATPDWGIIGVSLKRPEQRDRLEPQGGLYTAVEKDQNGERARIIGSVLGVLVAPEDPGAVLEAMSAPETRIVSLTVTEKGYCHDPATGRLDDTHPDIVHDLENPTEPRSAIGFIVEALERRREAGDSPFTVLCCDNLPHNGELVRGLVLSFAQSRDCGLAAWIERHGAFPSTMVDRIVPAVTPADIADVARLTGLADEAPVVHEPFKQWVIEDNFVDGQRPDWENAGAQLVEDVAPFELMKLRMLNGSHSSLAYLGYLAGCETIFDAVSEPALRAYVVRLWRDEIAPVLPPPPGADLRAYADALLVRFSNPAIRHRTWQIAMDGSQKLPQRLLGTIAERLARGLPIPCLALAVAAWIRYVGGVDERGQPIDVRDPMATDFRDALNRAGNDPLARVRAILGIKAVFGTELPADARFESAVAQAYATLLISGARRAAEVVAAS